MAVVRAATTMVVGDGECVVDYSGRRLFSLALMASDTARARHEILVFT